MADVHVGAADFARLHEAIRRNPAAGGLKLVAMCGPSQQLPGFMQDAGFGIVLRKPLFPRDLEAALAGSPLDEPQVEEDPVDPDRNLRCAAGKRVLLAEDNVVNQKVICRMLEKGGIEVVAVPDGSQAVAAFDAQPFDLVLMDIQMPVMDGLEALAAIRQRPGGALPIVAVTANAMKGERDRFLDSGFDGYLSKPVNLDALRAMLCRHFSKELPSAATLAR